MFKLWKRNVQLYKPSIQDMVILGNLCVNIILTRNARRRGMKASVNLQFSSFAPRHRLSELIFALGLASVATATRCDSVACDEGRFISPEECASAPLGLSP